MSKMNKENKLIIEQINKFGKVPETHELLQKIKELENINEKLSLALESAENKIDKAIEYVNSQRFFDLADNPERPWDYGELRADFLNILKGISE